MPAQFNTKSPTIKRILREASELTSSPSSDYHATPLETNLFEWHFTLRGPPSSPYAEGLYHGRIILPPTYPLRPPSFRFLTPSGRFETNREICLSISGHHEETWQPAWGIRTALMALRAFMAQEAKGQVGGLECGEAARKRFAVESQAWKCHACGGVTNREIMAECDKKGVGGVRLAEVEGQKSDDAVTIPAELRLGYRDEMTKAEPNELREAEKGVTTSATAHTGPQPQSQPPRSSSSVTSPQAVHTTTSSSSSVTSPRLHTPHQPNTTNNNSGVPAWIDKAIGGLLTCLVIMIVKKILT